MAKGTNQAKPDLPETEKRAGERLEPSSEPVTIELNYDHTYRGETYLRGSHEVDRETADVLRASEERVRAAREVPAANPTVLTPMPRASAPPSAQVLDDDGSVDSA